MQMTAVILLSLASGSLIASAFIRDFVIPRRPYMAVMALLVGTSDVLLILSVHP